MNINIVSLSGHNTPQYTPWTPGGGGGATSYHVCLDVCVQNSWTWVLLGLQVSEMSESFFTQYWYFFFFFWGGGGGKPEPGTESRV